MRINRIKFCTVLTMRDLTLIKLSQISGISRQTLSCIKQGKRCKKETGVKIAQALEIDITEIMEMEE